MEIRSYQESDYSKVKHLLKKSGFYSKQLDSKDILTSKIRDDSESIIVAVEEKRIIGIIYIIYDPWVSLVFHLGVLPEYMGKGVAHKLMDEAEKRLKARGILRPTLFVEKDNSEMIDFYKDRGWNVLFNVTGMEKSLE